MADFEHVRELEQAMKNYISGGRQDITPVADTFRGLEMDAEALIVGGHYREEDDTFDPVTDPISGKEYLTVFTVPKKLHYCVLDGVSVSPREILDFLTECPDVAQGIVLNPRQEAVILPRELLMEML